MCCHCGGGTDTNSCEDTNDGATNTYLNDCGAYDAEPVYCDEPDKYDDDDFTATNMCCSCSGGAMSALPEYTCKQWTVI